MVLFKDIHKKADDFVTKDWAHEKDFELENTWKANGFNVKNKGFFSCPSRGECVPSASTEIEREWDAGLINAKYDTDAKFTLECKAKQLVPNMILISKLTSQKATYDAEVALEYVNAAKGFHGYMNVLPLKGKEQFSVSGTSKIHDKLTVGAEIASTFAMKSVKFTAAECYGYGNLFVGSKLTYDTGSSNGPALKGFVGVSEGSSDALVQVAYHHGRDVMPTATVVGRHYVGKDLWLKASFNDDMHVKGSLGYRWSPNVFTSLGVMVDPNGKKCADQFKFGAKLSFSA